MTGQDYVTYALQKLGVVGAVDPPSPEDAAVALFELNQIFDDLNVEKAGAFAFQFLPFVLTPNLNPHTIGLAANAPTFSVTTGRPAKLYGANLVLNNVTPNVAVEIKVRDADWYQGVSVPSLTGPMPTDLYYEAAWPNGNCYFYPVPTVAYGVSLQVPVLFAQVTLVTTITLPFGYQDTVILTLAEKLAPTMKVPVSPSLAYWGRKARAKILAANDFIPPLATRDAGMPGGENRNSTTFNYRTRSWN